MKFQTLGGKPQYASVTVKNADTLIIPKGAPSFYDPTQTGDKLGLAVLSDTALAAANQGFFAGIAKADIGIARFGDSECYGLVPCRVIVATRSATSAVWASYVALAIGDIMGFSSAVSAQAIIRLGAGSADSAGYLIRAASSYASSTTQASTLGVSTALFSISLINCMLRLM